MVSFTPVAATKYPLDRRLGSPRTGLDAVEKRKVSCPYQK
jgi:hypothetical protein